MFLQGCIPGKQIFTCLKNNTFFLSFPLPKLLKALLLKQSLAVVSVKDSAPYIVLALEIQSPKLSFWDFKTKIYPSLLLPQTVGVFFLWCLFYINKKLAREISFPRTLLSVHIKVEQTESSSFLIM